MKVTILGVNQREGVSAGNGRPYNICVLNYVIPDESGQKKNDDGSIRWTYTGYGLQVRELPLNPSVLHSFADLEFPKQVDLVLEPQPTNPSRNWVNGVK